jgi:hypothetical protein
VSPQCLGHSSMLPGHLAGLILTHSSFNRYQESDLQLLTGP